MLRVRQAEGLARVLLATDGTGSRGGRPRACRGSRSGSGTTRPKRAATSGPSTASLCGSQQRARSRPRARRRAAPPRARSARTTRRGSARRVSMPSSRCEPLPAPRARAGRSGACETGRRARSASVARSASPASQRGAAGSVEVDVAVDPREQRLLVAVEHRPVHEQQPLLRAARARGLADVRRLAASDRRQRQPLRDVGVPELVVRRRARFRARRRSPRLVDGAAARRRGRRATRSTGALKTGSSAAPSVVRRSTSRQADASRGRRSPAGRAARRAALPGRARPGRRSRARRRGSGGKPRSTSPPTRRVARARVVPTRHADRVDGHRDVVARRDRGARAPATPTATSSVGVRLQVDADAAARPRSEHHDLDARRVDLADRSPPAPRGRAEHADERPGQRVGGRDPERARVRGRARPRRPRSRSASRRPATSGKFVSQTLFIAHEATSPAPGAVDRRRVRRVRQEDVSELDERRLERAPGDGRVGVLRARPSGGSRGRAPRRPGHARRRRRRRRSARRRRAGRAREREDDVDALLLGRRVLHEPVRDVEPPHAAHEPERRLDELEAGGRESDRDALLDRRSRRARRRRRRRASCATMISAPDAARRPRGRAVPAGSARASPASGPP